MIDVPQDNDFCSEAASQKSSIQTPLFHYAFQMSTFAIAQTVSKIHHQPTCISSAPFLLSNPEADTFPSTPSSYYCCIIQDLTGCASPPATLTLLPPCPNKTPHPPQLPILILPTFAASNIHISLNPFRQPNSPIQRNRQPPMPTS